MAADPGELYEHAACGLLLTDGGGIVQRANRTFLAWTGHRRDEVEGQRFDSLLTAAGRLFVETRFLPVLRLEGSVHELALELRRADGGSLTVLMNAVAAVPDGPVHIAVMKATQRRDYERELLQARRAAERSESGVRMLQAAATAFADTVTRQGVADALADAAGRAFDAAQSAVLLLENRELGIAGGSHPLGADALLDRDGPELRVLRGDDELVLSDPAEVEASFPHLAAPLRRARVEALSATLVREEGKAAGVLTCFFGRPRQLTREELDLQASLCRLAGQALTRIALQETLRELALQDELTGLPNRALLRGRLVEALAEARAERRAVALIFVDLDGFKAINDELGHAVGDRVLAEVAQRLSQVVRRSDTIGRYGGDEFMVICRGANPRTARAIAERLAGAVRAPLADMPPGVGVTASIGVAALHPSGEEFLSADGLVAAADAAMYAAKREGRDGIRIVEPSPAELV
ncbi:diguanylate cyclase [Naasia sp. SYSU D00057]|uniref:diguanylate cyclase n=1 Tax=Naasia sp. SYSU D00057 TaxID=2817380 RepID=UPI001B309A0D|nr:diguanylate cyclase [Naasia sp. SYSU D00057]